jgi:hypothetical protein
MFILNDDEFVGYGRLASLPAVVTHDPKVWVSKKDVYVIQGYRGVYLCT